MQLSHLVFENICIVIGRWRRLGNLSLQICHKWLHRKFQHDGIILLWFTKQKQFHIKHSAQIQNINILRRRLFGSTCSNSLACTICMDRVGRVEGVCDARRWTTLVGNEIIMSPVTFTRHLQVQRRPSHERHDSICSLLIKCCYCII